jgi:hypothetical protein
MSMKGEGEVESNPDWLPSYLLSEVTSGQCLVSFQYGKLDGTVNDAKTINTIYIGECYK